MTIGSTKDENGKKVYHFNITEEEMQSILENPNSQTINAVAGNSEFDFVHFELKVKKAVKRQK
jgi:hypothetical protein